MISVKIDATQGASLWEVEDENHIKPKGLRLVRISHLDQEGKGFSTNDYDDADKALVGAIPDLTEAVSVLDVAGDGTHYLADDGTYKAVSGGSGTAEDISVEEYEIVAEGSVQGAIETIVDAVMETDSNIGDLDDLDTTEKDSLVGAINEVAASGGTYYPYPIDEPPATPSDWDDEFDGESLDEKWSWVNQGTATAEISGGALYMDMLSGGDHSRLLVQAAPEGDFTVFAKASIHGPCMKYLRCGLVLYNSANGNRIIFGPRNNDGSYGILPGVMGLKCQNASFTSDLPFALATFTDYYLRIRNVSSTLYLEWSVDGIKWVLLTSETIANYLGAITHIGVAYFRNNTDGKTYWGKFDFFRVEEPL